MLGWTKEASAIDIRVATQRVNQIFNITINNSIKYYTINTQYV
jgi:hypothetical protein